MRLLGALLLAVPLCAQVKIAQAPGRVTVEIDGKPYTEFFLAPGGAKPYLYPLRTAAGIVVTRHYPMEKFPGETRDHPYHRGLYFSHGDINGYDFWGNEPGQTGPRIGRMELKQVAEAQGGPRSGRIVAVFDGLDAQGKAMMTETRTIVFHADPTLRMIDYEVSIEPRIRLTYGDTKEGTFAIRLATALSEDRTGRMVSADGRETEKNVWGKRSPWVDYYGQVDGQTVGVAIFDHPSNPRHPTWWHARAYGLFAANIFGLHDFTGDKSQNASLTLEPGGTLRFRYRVVIHPGDVKAANIAALYREYAAGR